MAEVYVNMGRIIKDTVKSISFPPVQQLADTDEDALQDSWEERNAVWDGNDFRVAELEWQEVGTYEYVYESQDTRRKFNFDPERLRVA